MNIEGLDYNTQREHLVLPEYGREIQKMVDHAVTLESREERQQCAETIIAIMSRMFPHNGEADHKRKLWDHLALMSNFKLDIDWPFDVSQAAKIATKPEPMAYPMQDIPVRHYDVPAVGPRPASGRSLPKPCRRERTASGWPCTGTGVSAPWPSWVPR